MCTLDKVSEFQKLCIRNCIKHSVAIKYRSSHKSLTDAEVIEACRLNRGYTSDQQFTLEQLCEAAEINYTDLVDFIDTVSENSDTAAASDADYIIGFINTQRLSIDDICTVAKQSGVDITAPRFKGLQRKHPDWTAEDIIGYCMLNPSNPNTIYTVTVNNKKYTLKQFCDNFITNLSYKAVREQVIHNNQLDLQSLVCLTNNLTLNIFGQVVYTEAVEDNRGMETSCTYSLGDSQESVDNRTSSLEDNKGSIDSRTSSSLVTTSGQVGVGTKVSQTPTSPHPVTYNNITYPSIRSFCRENNINIKTFNRFQNTHQNCPIELVIKYFLHPDKLTTKDKCMIASVNYSSVYHYKERHPELSVEQAIRKIKQRDKETSNESEQ